MEKFKYLVMEIECLFVFPDALSKKFKIAKDIINFLSDENKVIEEEVKEEKIYKYKDCLEKITNIKKSVLNYKESPKEENSKDKEENSKDKKENSKDKEENSKNDFIGQIIDYINSKEKEIYEKEADLSNRQKLYNLHNSFEDKINNLKNKYNKFEKNLNYIDETLNTFKSEIKNNTNDDKNYFENFRKKLNEGIKKEINKRFIYFYIKISILKYEKENNNNYNKELESIENEIKILINYSENYLKDFPSILKEGNSTLDDFDLLLNTIKDLKEKEITTSGNDKNKYKKYYLHFCKELSDVYETLPNLCKKLNENKKDELEEVKNSLYEKLSIKNAIEKYINKNKYDLENSPSILFPSILKKRKAIDDFNLLLEGIKKFEKEVKISEPYLNFCNTFYGSAEQIRQLIQKKEKYLDDFKNDHQKYKATYLSEYIDKAIFTSTLFEGKIKFHIQKNKDYLKNSPSILEENKSAIDDFDLLLNNIKNLIKKTEESNAGRYIKLLKFYIGIFDEYNEYKEKINKSKNEEEKIIQNLQKNFEILIKLEELKKAFENYKKKHEKEVKSKKEKIYNFQNLTNSIAAFEKKVNDNITDCFEKAKEYIQPLKTKLITQLEDMIKIKIENYESKYEQLTQDKEKIIKSYKPNKGTIESKEKNINTFNTSVKILNDLYNFFKKLTEAKNEAEKLMEEFEEIFENYHSNIDNDKANIDNYKEKLKEVINKYKNLLNNTKQFEKIIISPITYKQIYEKYRDYFNKYTGLLISASKINKSENKEEKTQAINKIKKELEDFKYDIEEFINPCEEILKGFCFDLDKPDTAKPENNTAINNFKILLEDIKSLEEKINNLT